MPKTYKEATEKQRRHLSSKIVNKAIRLATLAEFTGDKSKLPMYIYRGRRKYLTSTVLRFANEAAMTGK